ncbi:MAG: type IV secretory system conjugative DNA transfer family protein [Oscillospiraceae bacterium]|nr:type IV secretory system conjugative DNA transfer family protein [Oscillospiraceae bacterium]
MTISIYAVLAAFGIYFAAALGACFDLSLDENGKADFDKLANSLEATLMDTDIVFEQLKKGEKALQFPIFAAFGIGLYALMKVTNKKKFHRKGEEHGSARWANQKEIKSLLDKPPKQKKENIFKRIFIKIKGWFKARDKPEITDKNTENSEKNISEKNTKIKMSDIPKLRAAKKEHEYIIDNNIVLTNDVKMSLNTRQTRKNLNVMVIGGSGSGKSRFYVKPNLMQANTSYVCTDPKGELLRSTGKMLKHYGYKIKVFNLIDMAHSNNYNPFQYIYDVDGNYSATAVIKMVNVLMKNTQKEGGGGSDQFWDDSTKALLAALCFYLVECENREMQNFSEVMKLLKKAEVKEGEDNFQSDLDLIFDALEFPEKYTKSEAENDEQFKSLNLIDLAKKAKPASQYMCLKYYKDFKKAAGDTAKSILISTAVRLQAFNIPEVMDLTCCDNLHLEELGDEKQALYIIIPSSDDTFNFWAAMMYTQMFDVLYDRANFKYGGRLPVHVRCLLDEFSNIGQIPRFEELLATMRSMEISANVIIQNLSQLKKMYKDSWENVLGNCDSLLFLGGQEPTTLEHISKTLGKETIDTRSNNRTRGRNGSTSENDGILGRELMTVDELKIMKDNECILFVRGLYPFFCDKFVIEKHPNYKLLEDFDSQNAYLIKDIETVKFNDNSGAEDEDLHSETVDEEVFEQINSAEKIGNEISQNGKDVPEKNVDETEQSVTIEEIVSGEIVGNKNHLHNNFPKRPQEGSEPANLDNTEVIVTSEPNLKPPFIEVAEKNYLDIFDEI